MGKVDIELNYKGIGALLKGPEMRNMLENITSDIKQRCGEGYENDTKNMGTRVIASVYTGTFEAMQDNLENNTILKGLK